MLTRFDFNPRFDTFFRDLDQLWKTPQTEGERALFPAADVRDTDTAVELRVDLPGVNPEAIDVKLEGRLLTIRAERTEEKTSDNKGWVRRERATGHFLRSFTLDDTLDGSKLAATYKHGVLTLSVPRREETQPRTLKVKVEA